MTYFIAPDAHNEPTLWRGNPDDPAPVAVLTRHELAEHPDVWRVLAREFDDPWFTPAEQAELRERITARMAEVADLPTNPPF